MCEALVGLLPGHPAPIFEDRHRPRIGPRLCGDQGDRRTVALVPGRPLPTAAARNAAVHDQTYSPAPPTTKLTTTSSPAPGPPLAPRATRGLRARQSRSCAHASQPFACRRRGARVPAASRRAGGRRGYRDSGVRLDTGAVKCGPLVGVTGADGGRFPTSQPEADRRPAADGYHQTGDDWRIARRDVLDQERDRVAGAASGWLEPHRGKYSTGWAPALGWKPDQSGRNGAGRVVARPVEARP
jgi:hypothetical protein